MSLEINAVKQLQMDINFLVLILQMQHICMYLMSVGTNRNWSLIWFNCKRIQYICKTEYAWLMHQDQWVELILHLHLHGLEFRLFVHLFCFMLMWLWCCWHNLNMNDARIQCIEKCFAQSIGSGISIKYVAIALLIFSVLHRKLLV